MTTTSRSTVADVGTTVTFDCRTDTTHPIRWIFNGPHTKHDVHLYNGYKLKENITDRYAVTVDANSGRNMLIITNVQLEDAGSYECREVTAAKYSNKFELVVLGTHSIQLILGSYAQDLV